MKIGLHVVSFSWPDAPDSIASTLAGIATAADEAGISELSFMDHWFQMDVMAPATEPMLEGYTSLGYMAALTERVTLGLLVTGVTYRAPGLLAKTVATVDVLSGGRGATRSRRRLVPARARGSRCEVPARQRALRTTRGGAAGLHADVERRQRAVHGPALPTRGDDLRAASDQPAAAARDDRRERRAQDPPTRRPLRGRVQPLRRRSG